jgi:ATP adenylyltransferase
MFSFTCRHARWRATRLFSAGALLGIGPRSSFRSSHRRPISARFVSISYENIHGVTRQLWAPWRLEYVQSAGERSGCVFCNAARGDDEAGLVVHRGELAFVLLNRFPYSSGHLMVAPYRHVGELSELGDSEALEIHTLATRGLAALRAVYGPEGFNLGWNLGRVAGAGVVDHVHLHVVPRWAGDTNFMPVLADVKVLPEHLDETRSRLVEAWPAQRTTNDP